MGQIQTIHAQNPVFHVGVSDGLYQSILFLNSSTKFSLCILVTRAETNISQVVWSKKICFDLFWKVQPRNAMPDFLEVLRVLLA